MSDRLDLDRLHFLLIPLLCQSHIIPLTDFAQLLAHHGVAVSIITTPTNHTRYAPEICRAAEAGLNLRMIPFDLPGCESGLLPDQGFQNMDTASKILTACETLAAPLEKLMAEMRPKPSCIVSTSAVPWTQDLADKFEIPRYIFETISCFTRLCAHTIAHAELKSDSDSFVVPGVPHRIEFTRAQLPNIISQSNDESKIYARMRSSRVLARAAILNSFEEMEGAYAEAYKNVAIPKKLWCIGPVSQWNRSTTSPDDQHHDSISWLDTKRAESVIYACFGSLCRISDEQIKEIGLGLEASGFNFIWVIRGMDSSLEVEKWLGEEKIEERVKGRGLIIRRWAPQVMILSHPSVGGFLTHCGWNSTLEGVGAGVPMITWPMFAEQFYNEKFVVHVLRIGVRVGVEAEAKIEPLVDRDRVKRAIEGLMEEGEEGKERRMRAKKLSEMARATLEEGGSSYMNIKLFIQDVASCM